MLKENVLGVIGQRGPRQECYVVSFQQVTVYEMCMQIWGLSF